MLQFFRGLFSQVYGCTLPAAATQEVVSFPAYPVSVVYQFCQLDSLPEQRDNIYKTCFLSIFLNIHVVSFTLCYSFVYYECLSGSCRRVPAVAKLSLLCLAFIGSCRVSALAKRLLVCRALIGRCRVSALAKRLLVCRALIGSCRVSALAKRLLVCRALIGRCRLSALTKRLLVSRALIGRCRVSALAKRLLVCRALIGRCRLLALT